MAYKEAAAERRTAMPRHRRQTPAVVDPAAIAAAAAGTPPGTGSNSASASIQPTSGAASASRPASTAAPSHSASTAATPPQTTAHPATTPPPSATNPPTSAVVSGSQTTSISLALVTTTSTPLASYTALPSTQTQIPLHSNYFTQYTTTNADGQVFTVTNLVSGPGATGGVSSQSAASHSGFFQNKGAVAATFIIVGLAGTACFLVGLLVLVRRHRQRQFERDAALTAEHAARTTKRPPSGFLDDEDDDRAMFPKLQQQSPPQMTQSNVGYGGTGYGGGAGPGLAGFGATSAVAGAGMGMGAARAAARSGNSPPPNDYYASMPYPTGGGAGSGYPPQPQPAFSHSSHGGNDEYDEYAGAAGWNAPYIGGGDGQGLGHAPNPPAQGGYPGYYQQQQQPQYQQQQAQRQHQGDPYGGYERPRTPPPSRGGRVPIQPQNLYVPKPVGGASSQESAGGYSQTSNYGRNLTPDVPPGQSGGNNKGGASRRSLMDDASSAKSYYSDEDEPQDLQPKRSLRIANA